MGFGGWRGVLERELGPFERDPDGEIEFFEWGLREF